MLFDADSWVLASCLAVVAISWVATNMPGGTAGTRSTTVAAARLLPGRDFVAARLGLERGRPVAAAVAAGQGGTQGEDTQQLPDHRACCARIQLADFTHVAHPPL